MFVRFCLLIGLGAFAAGHALPDIISNVTVNGSVSGAGSVTVECGIATPGCQPAGSMGGTLSVSYSFGGGGTQLGSFFSAGGSATTPSDVPNASADGYAEGLAYQVSAPTADSLGIFFSAGRFGTGAFKYFSGSEAGSVSIGFDLTEASTVNLSGFISSGTAPNAGELLDSAGNVLLVLPIGVSSASTVLEPGMYRYDASIEGIGLNSFRGSDEALDFRANLEATFTPVPTPEPRWSVLAALLAGIAGGFIIPRRRRVT